MMLTIAALSCVREAPPARTSGLVEFRIDCGRPSATRGMLDSRDDGISQLLLLFYENGSLLPQLTIDGAPAPGESIRVSLQIGHTYEVVAFANCRPAQIPQSVGEALGLEYSCDGIGDWSAGVPMSCYKSFKAAYAMPPVPLVMVRLVSRLNFTVDTSGLQHGSMTFSSIAVRQMNRRCPFFGQGAAALSSDVCDGDLASQSDLQGINASGGYSTSFYLLENMQGDILAGNTDPDKKIPDSVEVAGRRPELCTYLEIKGSYTDRSGFLKSENVLAHLYLGANAESNFDLMRNCSYTVTLNISDNGCLRTDWKIDCNLQDDRVLRFDTPSHTVGKGATVSVPLTTNLSLPEGDYTYTVTGDTDCLSVSPQEGGFCVESSASVTNGKAVVIVVRSWDGALESSCRVEARFSDSTRINVDWDNDLYLAQMGTIEVIDDSGAIDFGRLMLRETNHLVRVEKVRPGLWHVYAIAQGADVLTFYIGSSVFHYITVDIQAPVMAFADSRIFLPLDGRTVECGPYYYRQDGSRLYRSDFDAELYDSLLAFDLIRDNNSSNSGKYWDSGLSAGNPVISKIAIGTEFEPYGFRISAFSSQGRTISENYRFESGEVNMENIRAKCRVAGYCIPDAKATLYTADPFAFSKNWGGVNSWALAYWRRNSTHDEVLSFRSSGLIGEGNDCSYATATTDSGSPALEFSFPDLNTMKMKIKYDSYGIDAMPKYYLDVIPGIINRVSGEIYTSVRTYSMTCINHLAVGGVASENGSAGSTVSVEWSFPRSSVFSQFEDIICSSVSGTVQGLYNPLYTVGGTPSQVMSSMSPDYSFCHTGYSPGTAGLVSGDSYSLPETDGRRFMVWKYSKLFSGSRGWLEK